MSEIDWFKFENKDLDFPFYKKNPYIPKWGWIILFFVMFIGLFLSMSSKIHITALSCIVIIVPVLYFLKWDYKAIFQKPKAKEILLAVGLFVGYIIYALAMSTVLENFGIIGGGANTTITTTIMDTIPLFFALMSEEFVKFIPFMFFLRVIFKFSNNRKMSVIISVLFVMIFFAFLHAYDVKTLIFAIFIQGFGSIFEFIGYIKTKNILISYITHLCTDLFILLIGMLGV